ncbi:very short patch repair endonuclease [Propionivibrio limicola]|uniref:very short patch repair endonuclease n=1 Tax=Propionivibrio limicola TaxID=167645 RepID=UPI001290A6B0|nr:DNA mismatch endonuclease Vsr [Propionivibrio limicola]
MVDVVDEETRSRMMAGIRGKDTKPELLVRRYLHGRGLRFRLHVANLPGKPDMVFPKYRTVVFVHGCFWHRHRDCKYATTPATRSDFWANKFRENLNRDQYQFNALRELGWKVLVVWECELREGTSRLTRLFSEITGRG